MGAVSLDHVGIAGRELGPLAVAWERLGFRLTPMARHAGRRAPGAPVEPFATGNRCIMLRQGYIELIAIVAPGALDNLVGPALDRYPGIHTIALGIDDEVAELARLRAAGISIPGVAQLERPVDDADPEGLRARFARLPLPDAPEGRIMLIRHLTPEAIWQERFLAHPNRSVALEAVVLAVADPAEAAARFSRLAGRPVIPDPVGGYALPLPQGRVRVLPADALDAVFPGLAAPTLPFIAGIAVRTDDGGARARRIAAAAGIALSEAPDGATVSAADAGGAAILFS